MEILSQRKGFECDHSTRDYGYINGIKVYYDYGAFDLTFVVPYKTELFKELRKYKDLTVEKKFNKIEVNLYLYSEEIGEDEYEWAELANEIKKEIMDINSEVLGLLNAYSVGDEEKFGRIKTETKLGKKLKSVLTFV